jgi:RNA polymerase sigma-70 factor (sigma-E family)
VTGTTGLAEGEGFDELFRAHRDRVYRLAVLLHGDRVAAEDAAADAFARVFVAWKRGGVDDAAAYLRRTLVNGVRSEIRHRIVERRAAARRTGDDRGCTDMVDRSVDRDALVTALRRLPPRQRTAVVLRYFEDLPEADVASAMHTSIGTAKAHVSRGLLRLREMPDLGGGDER